MSVSIPNAINFVSTANGAPGYFFRPTALVGFSVQEGEVIALVNVYNDVGELVAAYNYNVTAGISSTAVDNFLRLVEDEVATLLNALNKDTVITVDP